MSSTNNQGLSGRTPQARSWLALLASSAIGTTPLLLQAAEPDEPTPAAPAAQQDAQPAPAAPAQEAEGADSADAEADSAQTARLSEVQVQGESLSDAQSPMAGYVAEDAISATKTDTPIMKTPQDISTITTDEMRDRNTTSIAQALNYTGGVVPEARGTSGTRYDLIKLRGFDPEQYLDGLRLGSYYYTKPKTDPYLLERVDVVKGPSSILYGQAPPGGIVNYVSKRPSKAAENEFFLQGGNGARFRGGFDIGGSLLDDDSLLYRVVAVGERFDGPQHGVETANVSVAPSLKWQIDDDTHLTLLAKYRHDPSGGSYGSLPYEGTVTPLADGKHIKRSFYDGDEDFQHFNRHIQQIGYEFAHDFDKHVKFRQNLRYERYHISNRYAYGFGGWAEDRKGQDISRLLMDNNTTHNVFSVDNHLQFDFDTSQLEHKILAGVDYQNLTARRDTGDLMTPAPAQNIYRPDHHMNLERPERDHYNFSQYQLGYYLQDQISWGNLVLLGGGRYDHVRTSEFDHGSDDHNTRSDHAATVRAGILYADPSGLSPYFSYSESFQPPSTQGVEAEVLKPTRGDQYEVGLKYQPKNMPLMLSSSFFQTRQKNVPGPDPDNPGQQIQTGEVEIRGVELNARASVLEGLDLLASATWLDSRIKESTEGNKGNRLQQTPKYTASLWADYTQPTGRWQGLGGGGGVRYVGSQQVDNENTAKVPSYTVFDLTAHYELGGMSKQLEGWRVALNMDNITNKRYVASCEGTGSCFYGQGRETTANISYHWD